MATRHQRIPTRISPDILDTIGKSFKFKHAKGVAEWLKNSLDNYLRLREQGKEPRNGNWPVFINLSNSVSSKPNLAVVDFGGTYSKNIEDFFLFWGSRSAATLGGSTANAFVTGGHGNGGKFYMREMWRSGSRFLTWRDGKATSLIVDKKNDGTTGEWEFRDEEMDWRKALMAALPASEGSFGGEGLVEHIENKQPELASELETGKRGLTALVGRRAVQVYTANDVVSGGKWNFEKLVDEIRDAPQARRPIRELAISIFLNGDLKVSRLSLESLNEDPDWSTEETSLPMDLLRDDVFIKGATSVGVLRIQKSIDPLSGRLKDQNAMFVTDQAGNPIAWYPLKEVPLPGHSPILIFLHGELQLTFPNTDNLVENDRERLVASPTTEALLSWVGEQIWQRVQMLEESQQASKHKNQLQVAAILNDALNQHAKRFLQELQTRIMIDLVEDATGGGPGESGNGTGPVRTGETKHEEPPEEDPAKRGGSPGAGGTLEVPGTAQAIRRPRFPQVLLSDIDADPANADGMSKHLTERHPPLYQDDIDKQYNVWWINTIHPFATAALEHGGEKGNAFRSHQLFMFRDVVQREGIRILQKQDTETDLATVENQLDEISNQFLGDIPHDLIEELLG